MSCFTRSQSHFPNCPSASARIDGVHTASICEADRERLTARLSIVHGVAQIERIHRRMAEVEAARRPFSGTRL